MAGKILVGHNSINSSHLFETSSPISLFLMNYKTPSDLGLYLVAVAGSWYAYCIRVSTVLDEIMIDI